MVILKPEFPFSTLKTKPLVCSWEARSLCPSSHLLLYVCCVLAAVLAFHRDTREIMNSPAAVSCLLEGSQLHRTLIKSTFLWPVLFEVTIALIFSVFTCFSKHFFLNSRVCWRMSCFTIIALSFWDLYWLFQSLGAFLPILFTFLTYSC